MPVAVARGSLTSPNTARAPRCIQRHARRRRGAARRATAARVGCDDHVRDEAAPTLRISCAVDAAEIAVQSSASRPSVEPARRRAAPRQASSGSCCVGERVEIDAGVEALERARRRPGPVDLADDHLSTRRLEVVVGRRRRVLPRARSALGALRGVREVRVALEHGSK